MLEYLDVTITDFCCVKKSVINILINIFMFASVSEQIIVTVKCPHHFPPAEQTVQLDMKPPEGTALSTLATCCLLLPASRYH